MDMSYDGVLVMPTDCVFMEVEEMRYVEGGGWKKIVMELLWHACKTVFGHVAKSAFIAAIPTVKGAMVGIKAAMAAVPWSRVAAVAILAGYVGTIGWCIWKTAKVATGK